MQESDVHQLALCGVFENTRIQGKTEETHISWVVLTRKYAFKIKKPMKLAFLDFSTLALRKEFCEKELSLNSRFTNIYLSVQPVWFSNGRWCIGGSPAEKIVDYCVVMKRMSLTRRMDNKLRSHKVSEGAVRALAAEVATFHNVADKVFTRFDPENARNLFNDIQTIRNFASDNIGKQFNDIISQSIEWSDDFLERHRSRIQERIDQGLKRDVHGDLHSRNIFLYRRPVLFDCIEFND